MIVDPHLYRKAFVDYIRKGTPIERSLKQARPTTHYIWRTRRDRRVRSQHADREGRVFSWNDPPTGGHPGEDFNCRCTAEPYYPEVAEYMELWVEGVGTKSGWTNHDFEEHYFRGRGRGVTLREIGHFEKIVGKYINDRGDALKGQIADAARRVGTGTVTYTFGKPYNMQDVVFSPGHTTIGGVFFGQSLEENGILQIEGILEFYHKDEFADPVDLRIEVDDYRPGSMLHDIGHGVSRVGDVISDVSEAVSDGMNLVDRTLTDRYLRIPSENYFRRNKAHDSKRYTKDIRTGRDGVPYPITDEWSGRLKGQVYADVSRSRYVPRD